MGQIRIAETPTREARGRASAAICDPPEPCRKSASPLGRLLVDRRRRGLRTPAVHGSRPPPLPVIRPAGRRRQNPISSCASRSPRRGPRGHVAT
eukprot:3416564-Pleurochrysis_carterae.AAC.1